MTIEMASSTSSNEDDGSWAGADFFGLDDLGLYFILSVSATTSSMAVTLTMVATSSRGHDARRQRLRTTPTRHER
jgi:hypothetical protein